jgi:hypothetical protein
MLQFETVQFSGIGGGTSLKDRQWGALTLIFNDTDTDHRRVIEVNTLLPRSPDVTLGELEDAAREDVLATLRAALAALEKSTVDELRG